MTLEEKQEIRDFARACGIEEKQTSDGEKDLSPWIYAFALAMKHIGMLRAASICFDRAEHLNQQRNHADACCGKGAGIFYRVSRDEADHCKALIRTAAAHLEQP